MPSIAAKKRGQRTKSRRPARASIAAGRSSQTEAPGREGRFETVMNAAARSGLLNEKSSRIAGRVSPALVSQAKKRTGIEADTDLIEFALANVALEDNFAETFKDARGKIGTGLKLGY